MSKGKSYAEITLKSGAVITFECTKLAWKRDPISTSLEWTLPEGATRRPVHIDINEIAAAVFVDGSR